MNHDIFRTPHNVQLTIEERATPENYSGYADGQDLGETMPMWRVQTEGYSDGTDQLPGLVSRDAGFLDSPDTELISSGVNTKTPNAVAIGRHGNFFHWGFAASPTYLTDEGKLVFVNSIHYIARFDGQAPIARKNPMLIPRKWVLDTIVRMSEAEYDRTVAFYEKFNAKRKVDQAALQARLDAGEELSDRERQTLGFPLSPVPGRFDKIRNYLSAEAAEQLGDDPEAIEAYLLQNLPYMHPSETQINGRSKLVIDEELKSFGIGNADPALLPRLIEALGEPDRAATARTLLERYTTESFATQAEWQAWLDQNRELLFFTEVCGYKWMVNRETEPKPPQKTKTAAAPTPKPKPSPTLNQPLAATLSIKALGDHRYALTLQVEILDGWHGYDAVAAGSPYTPMQPELVLPAGLQLDGDWQRPPSHPDLIDPTIAIFEGALAFRCELIADAELDPSSIVTCRLSYMVCDERSCLPPKVEEFTASLTANR